MNEQPTMEFIVNGKPEQRRYIIKMGEQNERGIMPSFEYEPELKEGETLIRVFGERLPRIINL